MKMRCIRFKKLMKSGTINKSFERENLKKKLIEHANECLECHMFVVSNMLDSKQEIADYRRKVAHKF